MGSVHLGTTTSTTSTTSTTGNSSSNSASAYAYASANATLAAKRRRNVSQNTYTSNNNNTTTYHSLPPSRSVTTAHRPSSRLSTSSASSNKIRPLPSTESLSSPAGNRSASGHPIITRGGTRQARPSILPADPSPTTITTFTAKPTIKTAPTVPTTVLRRKDQNAALVTKPAMKNPTITNMHNPNPNNSNRPHLPTLSANAARGRPPITPKIAVKPQTPNVAVRTPHSRPTLSRPNSILSNRTDTSTPKKRTSQHDDPPSTLAPHLSANVTPRSGPRQTRTESANTTPNGTPNPERSEGWDTRSSFTMSSPPSEGDAPRRPMVSFSSSVHSDINAHGKQDAQNAADSKFFHASDAKSSRPTSASSKPATSKGPTFFYANGNTVDGKPANPTTSTPVLAANHQDNLSNKFMYANGAPELRPSPPPLASRGSGSTVSTSSKAPIRPGLGMTMSSHSGSQRSTSPTKFPPQQQPLPKNSTTAVGAGRPGVPLPPQLGPSPPRLRRSSTGTSRSGGHSRTGSLVKSEVGGASNSKPPMASPVSELFPAAHIAPKPPPLTLASIIQAADEFGEEHTEEEHDNDDIASPSDDAPSGLQSPTKSAHSTAEPVNELVANARRERKVQDLQIRNASLEAINRTLERQLRKQTAELRRYRRLSRSGRLSLASTALSSRVASETLSEGQAMSLQLSDLSEEESDMEDSLGEESFSDSDSYNSSLSPSVLAERDAKHRERDEQRLRLDLSKHQELLIDSQKINQSIKRCLDWTEELISEGKKALEYKVRVSDVKLGGRVLDPLDEDDEHHFPADESPDDTITLNAKIGLEGEPEQLTTWGITPQDRDSGIELPTDRG
ncbi:hypothetical protein F5Y15DRAFT_26563 [Xylariaceae sp. FL0016]|nr:hypothetical protein F5Y15DRAFT_26563 [Xylariaceae sp. FL0016]